MVISVYGLSRKGKERVKEHGNAWEVIDFRQSVPCLGHRPGRMLRSVGTGYRRWMADEGDEDFGVVGEGPDPFSDTATFGSQGGIGLAVKPA